MILARITTIWGKVGGVTRKAPGNDRNDSTIAYRAVVSSTMASSSGVVAASLLLLLF